MNLNRNLQCLVISTAYKLHYRVVRYLFYILILYFWYRKSFLVVCIRNIRIYVNKKPYTIWAFITIRTLETLSATELFYSSRTHAIYCRQDILFLPYEIKAFRYSHDIPYGNNLPYYHIESNNDIRGSSHI